MKYNGFAYTIAFSLQIMYAIAIDTDCKQYYLYNLVAITYCR